MPHQQNKSFTFSLNWIDCSILLFDRSMHIFPLNAYLLFFSFSRWINIWPKSFLSCNPAEHLTLHLQRKLENAREWSILCNPNIHSFSTRLISDMIWVWASKSCPMWILDVAWKTGQGTSTGEKRIWPSEGDGLDFAILFGRKNHVELLSALLCLLSPFLEKVSGSTYLQI